MTNLNIIVIIYFKAKLLKSQKQDKCHIHTSSLRRFYLYFLSGSFYASELEIFE